MDNSELLKQAALKMRELGREMISDSDFNSTLAAISQRVTSLYDGTIQPCLLILQGNSEEHEYTSVPLHEDQINDRYQVLRELGREVGRRGISPTAIFLVTEVWRSRQTLLPPSDDPAREELLMITGCTLDFRSNMACSTIIRTGDKVTLRDPALIPFQEDTSGERVTPNLLEEFYKGFMHQVVCSKDDLCQNN